MNESEDQSDDGCDYEDFIEWDEARLENMVACWVNGVSAED